MQLKNEYIELQIDDLKETYIGPAQMVDTGRCPRYV